MAKTPEGKVKDRIKDILGAADAWFHMPVSTGFGSDTVDFICAHPLTGLAFIIEAKRPGKEPTARQRKRLREAFAKNMGGFVLDGHPVDLLRFKEWLLNPKAPAETYRNMIHKWDIWRPDPVLDEEDT